MPHDASRRDFLKTSSALIVGGALAPRLAANDTPNPGRALGDATIRVALVGCGGRGTGAAAQALRTAGPVELVAMADAFEDRIESSHGQLVEALGEQVQVNSANRYVGFDAYRDAIDSGVDLVILATPPGFRPQHFEYCIERGKHVFMEKPVAVDAPGVRSVLETARAAKQKNLKVGVGLQRHHDPLYVETVQRIQEGAIGEVTLLRVYWNSEGVWVRERQKKMTEMEYQMRNWYYFNWLCGDHIVEQHIHNIDVGNWVKGGYPVKAQGQGGRLWRTGRDHGEIYDHHMVEYTFEDGTKMIAQCRHIPQTWSEVHEYAHGTLGNADISDGIIEAKGKPQWRFANLDVDPYQREHDALFDAVRKDQPFNEAEDGAYATMTAIMGRMATYSGQVVTWSDALASNVSLAPERLAWKAKPQSLPDKQGNYPIPKPGTGTYF